MKSKVLFIMHMPPPIHGAAMMGQYIHDSILINNEFNCKYINLGSATSLSDVGSIGIKKFFTILKQYRMIIKTLKNFTPDLVYITPNSGSKAFFKEYIITSRIKRMGFPIVAHFHNKGIAKRQNCFLYNKLFANFFSNIKIILLSEYLYSDVQKYIDIHNVYFCNNGIPQTLGNKSVTRNDDSKYHLLFLSNLLPDKGVYVLLDAIAILKERGICFVCDFVGAETSKINARQFAKEVQKRNIADVVEYLGPKYGAEKEKIWKSASLFVFPSLDECFPLVLIEAMQYSLPIVSTRVGGTPDIVQDGVNGFLCPCGDSLMLADKISHILSDKAQMISMGDNGYERYIQKFTLNIFEKNFIAILKDCIPSHL